MLGAANLTQRRVLSYADFVASITAKATDGSRTANSLANVSGNFIMPFSSYSDTLMGSSWSSVWAGGVSRTGSICRHAFPTETPFTENLASTRTVYMVTAYVADTSSYNPLTRNGLTSSGGDGNSRQSFRMTLFAYWDAALNAGMQLTPNSGGSPVAYIP